jgi:hypothetical protein
MLSLALAMASAVFGATGFWSFGLIAAVGAVLTGRYLFFVSVVPLSMGLTFLREKHA